MGRLAPALAVLAALAPAACGGDDGPDDGTAGGTATRGEATAPAALPEQGDSAPTVTRAEFERCLNREGLEVYEIDEPIPGVVGGRLDVGTESAEQITVLWPESKHVADVFVAEGGAAADSTEAELRQFFSAFGISEEEAAGFVQRAGNVIVTPDDDIGPDAEELAVLRGCVG